MDLKQALRILQGCASLDVTNGHEAFEVVKNALNQKEQKHEWKEGHEFPEKGGTYMSVSMNDNDWDHICKHCQERVLPTSTGQYYCPSCNGFVEAIRDSNKFTEKKENHKCPSCE